MSPGEVKEALQQHQSVRVTLVQSRAGRKEEGSTVLVQGCCVLLQLIPKAAAPQGGLGTAFVKDVHQNWGFRSLGCTQWGWSRVCKDVQQHWGFRSLRCTHTQWGLEQGLFNDSNRTKDSGAWGALTVGFGAWFVQWFQQNRGFRNLRCTHSARGTADFSPCQELERNRRSFLICLLKTY